MTNDGDALFRAVCESPEDDTPRLVYADWLEENGKPERAELIRLQCEGSHLNPAFPGDTARRNRASQLLKEFGDHWYAELPDVRGVAWGSLFVRGFIDTVRVADSRHLIATLQVVFDAAPLQYLSITNPRRRNLEALLADPRIARLVRLRIPGTIGSAEAKVLTEARLRFPNTLIE